MKYLLMILAMMALACGTAEFAPPAPGPSEAVPGAFSQDTLLSGAEVSGVLNGRDVAMELDEFEVMETDGAQLITFTENVQGQVELVQLKLLAGNHIGDLPVGWSHLTLADSSSVGCYGTMNTAWEYDSRGSEIYILVEDINEARKASFFVNFYTDDDSMAGVFVLPNPG
jgi:hypothetical protein